jgi:pheromone shutdown protein TraB
MRLTVGVHSARTAIGKMAAVLIIGTGHEYQRHQDNMSDREALRADFENLLHQVVSDRLITHIAEEAGNDEEVWKSLKDAEAKTHPAFAVLFTDVEVVDEPTSTIAKQIADDYGGKLVHVDIRPVDAKEMTIEQRDEAMAASVLEILKSAKSLLVICGEAHRVGIEVKLKKEGHELSSFSFPK